jgi:hypothetical protein
MLLPFDVTVSAQLTSRALCVGDAHLTQGRLPRDLDDGMNVSSRSTCHLPALRVEQRRGPHLAARTAPHVSGAAVLAAHETSETGCQQDKWCAAVTSTQDDSFYLCAKYDGGPRHERAKRTNRHGFRG